MKSTRYGTLTVVLVLACAGLVRADDPTSKFVSLPPTGSTLPPSNIGTAVQFEIWDSVTAGTQISTEAHTVDTDPSSTVTNDTGFADLLLGRPGGLDAATFPAGSSRYIDVTQDGVSVLAARIPLYASVFSLTSGPKGDKGDKGDPGPQGPQGAPGVVQTVTAADTSILASGTPQDRSLAVAAGGITNTHVNNGALSPAKILGTAATVGSDTFFGDQSVNGNVNTSGVISAGTQFNIGSDRVLSIPDGNLFLGGAAGRVNTGQYNAFLGLAAGQANTTGGYNAFLGQYAGYSNTTGYANAFLGPYAGHLNATGYANAFVGPYAGFYNTGGYYNTFLGPLAGYFNTTGNANAFVGHDAGYSNTTGNYNTFLGLSAGFNNTTGSFTTLVGYLADVPINSDLTNATAIGNRAVVNASNKVRLGNDAVTVIEGQVPYTYTSDKNQKEYFESVDADAVLAKIGALTVASWNYIGHDPQQFRHYGPVAQDFFAAFGQDRIGTIGTPTTINSGDLAGILMIGVQALEKRTQELQQENDVLKARLEAMERRLGGSAIQ